MRADPIHENTPVLLPLHGFNPSLIVFDSIVFMFCTLQSALNLNNITQDLNLILKNQTDENT